MEEVEVIEESGPQELAEALAENLSNAVILYFKAQGHHWNVMGSDFTEFHKFFGMIYEDVLEQFDPVGENLRKLGVFAPFRLDEFMSLSPIEDVEVGSDPMAMCRDLYDANNVMLESIDKCFKLATAVNEQGIANFIADRLDITKGWMWQLRSSTTGQ